MELCTPSQCPSMECLARIGSHIDPLLLVHVFYLFMFQSWLLLSPTMCSRFFAYDNASGKSSGSGTPSVVRYVASLSMRFETGSVLPQLVIQYASVSTQGLTGVVTFEPPSGTGTPHVLFFFTCPLSFFS